LKPYRALLAAICFQLLYHLFFFVFLVKLNQEEVQFMPVNFSFFVAILFFFILPGASLFILGKSKALGRSYVLLVNCFLFFLLSFKTIAGIHTTEQEKTLLPLRLLMILINLVIVMIALQKSLTRNWLEQKRPHQPLSSNKR